MLLVSKMYFRNKGRDDVNHRLLISFIINCIDFWTDIASLFVYYNFPSHEGIFPVAMTFVIVPYLLSMLIGSTYFVQGQWTTRHLNIEMHVNDRLKRWMERYMTLLFMFAMLSGSFYSGIEFCSTKLFSFGLFFFPLKRSEYIKMLNFKVITMILFANIPQFAIQIYFFTSIVDKEDNANYGSTNSNIVLVSMIFTILSMLVGSLPALLRVQNYLTERKYGGEGVGIVMMEPILVIKSDELTKINCFGVKMIENAMNYGLKAMLTQNSEELKLNWYLGHVECYYVGNHVTTKDEIHGYFEMKIVLNNANENEQQLNILKSYFKTLNDNNSESCLFLKKV